MEVDQSQQSRMVNHMNRNQPHFQFGGYGDEVYYNEYFDPMFQACEADYYGAVNQVNPEFLAQEVDQQFNSKLLAINENPVQVDDLSYARDPIDRV